MFPTYRAGDQALLNLKISAALSTAHRTGPFGICAASEQDAAVRSLPQHVALGGFLDDCLDVLLEQQSLAC